MVAEVAIRWVVLWQAGRVALVHHPENPAIVEFRIGEETHRLTAEQIRKLRPAVVKASLTTVLARARRPRSER